MTTGGCAEARISLGAYVLGALDPAERGRVDAHLATCPDCRDELASFAALPGLLGRVSRVEVEIPVADPGPQLLERLLNAAAAERSHDRRRRWVASVAAAVVLVATAAVGVGLAHSRTPQLKELAGPSQTFVATDPVTHVKATVKEVKKGWGATLQFTLSGISASLYPGDAERCQLVAVGSNGQTDIAASWATPTAGHDIKAIGATGISATDVTGFRVVGPDGSTLVWVPATWTATSSA
jgi:hypothetical protein